MPRLSKLALLPAALAIAAGLAVGPGMGQEDIPGLKGSVSVSRYIVPSDAALETGSVFNQELATSLLNGEGKADNNWYMVPAWCVGDWNSVRHVSTDPGRYNARSNLSIGTFADKTGQIWEYDRQGYWAEGKGSNSEAKAWVVARSPIEATERNLRFHEDLIAFTIDEKTKVIKNRDHIWQDSVMYRVPEKMIKFLSVTGTYDADGKPNQTALAITDHWKNAEFEPRLSDTASDGRPLYPMFVQYLKDHNMADRIPDAPPEAPGAVAKP